MVAVVVAVGEVQRGETGSAEERATNSSRNSRATDEAR